MTLKRGLLALVMLSLQASLLMICARQPGDFTAKVLNASANTTMAPVQDPNYDRDFGSDWQSIRIFRLMTPLQAPLRVYVESYPQATQLYKPHYFQYVKQSLDAWSGALDGRLAYIFTPDPNKADIRVSWVPAFPDKYTAGLSTYSVGQSAIQIKTIGVPDADIKANIIHEFGHALGIAGHSNDSHDIMVGMRRWSKSGERYEPRLSENDKAAIRRLYSQKWQRGENLYLAVKKDRNTAAPAIAGKPDVNAPARQMSSATRSAQVKSAPKPY